MTTSDIRNRARRPRPRWLIFAVAVTTAVFTAGGVSTPADAAGVVRTPYSETSTFTDDSCGYPTTIDRTYSGTRSIRAGTGLASWNFFTDNYSYREVHTNTVTGQWFVIRGNGQVKDVQATPLGGNLLEVVGKESGQPLVVEDSTGRVVLRAAGVVTFKYTVDTHVDRARNRLRASDRFEPTRMQS